MSATRPLSGLRLVLTRSAGHSTDWRARLEEQGAEVIELPLIHVTKDVDLHTLAEVFQELASYEWIIFTSANGWRRNSGQKGRMPSCLPVRRRCNRFSTRPARSSCRPRPASRLPAASARARRQR